MSDLLTVDEAREIAETIQWRQEHWEGEPLEQSIVVVLLNTGSKHVRVECIRGEWSGVKGDLVSRDGVPHCPNGHPLYEVSGGKRLALVDAPHPMVALTEGSE